MKTAPKYCSLFKSWEMIPQPIINSAIEDILIKVNENFGRPLKDCIALDIGCGSGEYANALTKRVRKVVGVEPGPELYETAKRNYKSNNKLILTNCAIENFKDNLKFDLAISLTTIEHMKAAKKSFKRVFELLKPGGVIYLTAPNKWWPIECHYKLPFLSWLPLEISNLYLKLFGYQETYENCSYSKSYFGMKSFFNQFPCTYEFLLPSNLDSEYIGYGNKSPYYRLLKSLGIKLINKMPIFWAISKGFIMVIKKND